MDCVSELQRIKEKLQEMVTPKNICFPLYIDIYYNLYVKIKMLHII